jgi:MscS family membrane protein
LEEKIKKYEVIFGILRRPEPILLIIFVSIIRGALNVLYVNVKLLNIIDKLIFVLYVSFGAWFLGKAAIIIIEKYLSRFTEDTTEQKRYDHLLPLIRTLVKVFIILIGMLLIISNFGYDVTGLVAGLGIGGVAIAFASRELLENFFSGIIIFTEKQFKVGDIVKSEEISGTITEINIRTSKIESFDGTVYIVPNSKLSQGIVENISKRKARRVIENVSLSHENSFEKIEKAKEIIKNLLHNNKKINDKYSYVIFDKFNTQTIDLYFDYWVNGKTGPNF